jgi:hypothetical protein
MRLFLFILSFTLVSCGTLRSPKNIIPVDSTPRGVEVSYAGEVVGTTPFFHEVDSGRSHTYTYKISNNNIEEDYSCSLNWGQSILPTSIVMLFYPVGTVFGGIGLTTDYFSGGLFRCHKDFTFNVSEKSTEKVEEKRKIIFLPVLNDDQLFSKDVFKKWIELNPKLKDEIVEDNELSFDLYERGITHLKNNDPKKIKRFYLNEIARKYNATHFYYFPFKSNQDVYHFEPKLIDAFSLTEVSDDTEKKFDVSRPQKHKDAWVKTILSVFKIIPNGFRLSKAIDPTVTFSYIDQSGDEDHDESQTDKHPKALPEYASAIRVENVLHPSEYKNWDLTGVIYPWLSASSWKSSDLGPNSDYNIWISNYYIFLSGELTFHTPVGAFSGGIGYGVNYSYVDDSLGNKTNNVGSTFNLNLNYVAFISRKFYFKLAIDIFNPEENIDYFNKYRLKNWSEGSIGIGYYFPSFRKMVRDWVNY